MITSILPPAGSRPLFIDFDLYTDGDQDFKSELITLMIDNIRELQQSMKLASQQNNIDLFHKACHKVKPTISMLNDPAFIQCIEGLNETDQNDTSGNMTMFDVLCNDIIRSLEKENAK
jgi:hypothetical protein